MRALRTYDATLQVCRLYDISLGVGSKALGGGQLKLGFAGISHVWAGRIPSQLLTKFIVSRINRLAPRA